MADHSENRPPTDSGNTNRRCSGIPNCAIFSGRADTPSTWRCNTDCSLTPNPSHNQANAVRILNCVSAVVNDFDASTTSVVAGLRVPISGNNWEPSMVDT